MPETVWKRLVKISVLLAGIAPSFGMVSLFLLQSQVVQAEDSQWVRPTKPGDPLLWGRKDGIVFGLPSQGGLPGPRGLIRVEVCALHPLRPSWLGTSEESAPND